MSGSRQPFYLCILIVITTSVVCSGNDIRYVQTNRTTEMLALSNATVRSKTECLRLCTLDEGCDAVAFKYKFVNSVQCINLIYDSCMTTDVDSYEVFQKEGRTYNTTKPESRNCKDLLDLGYTEDGVYTIYLPGIDECLSVYCDMTTDGGGWLVFQRRTDGSVHFGRNWNGYKYGFGDLLNEFWLGNDYIHQLTLSCTTLHVRCEALDGTVKTSDYSSFSIASETTNYRLSLSGSYGITDEISTYHNGRSFSTKDRDNDGYALNFCALQYGGGWWYGSCYHSNLNGVYASAMVSANMGATMRKSEMKMRSCT